MKNNENFVTVYASGGQHLIKTPKGEMIPCVISTRVTDNANDIPFVICKIHCNIANNDEPFTLNEDTQKQKIAELQRKLYNDKKYGDVIIQSLQDELKSIKSKWWYNLFG